MSSTLGARQLSAAAAESCLAPFVLFTGGKGGVGKTTVAANVAVQLASQGARALLVDLDLALGNVDVLLSLAPRFNLEHALAGECQLADCIVLGPGGVHVLPAASGTADLARLDTARRTQLLADLAELSRHYDVVIGDSSAGIGPDVLAFAARADVVIVVTAPDPAAVTDAYGLIKALESAADEHRFEIPTPELFLNLVSGADEAERVFTRLADVCRRFLSRAPRLAGWLPRSPRVLDAARRQAAFVLGTAKEAGTLERDQLARLAGHLARLCGRGNRAHLAPQASGKS